MTFLKISRKFLFYQLLISIKEYKYLWKKIKKQTNHLGISLHLLFSEINTGMELKITQLHKQFI